MALTVRYLTHPEVSIDPTKAVPNWSLSPEGAARVAALAARPGALSQTRRVISSDETKALETATPLARAVAATLEVRPRMHENDRSATGFLPPDRFEAAADAFFATPAVSFCGWETAEAAQRRIVAEVNACFDGPQSGDVLFVGHGAVGTLLFCALQGVAIDRRFDQSRGGGFWFAFGLEDRRPISPWQPMEALIAAD